MQNPTNSNEMKEIMIDLKVYYKNILEEKQRLETRMQQYSDNGELKKKYMCEDQLDGLNIAISYFDITLKKYL